MPPDQDLLSSGDGIRASASKDEGGELWYTSRHRGFPKEGVTMLRLEGLIPPMVTPLDAQRKLDKAGLKQLRRELKAL